LRKLNNWKKKKERGKKEEEDEKKEWKQSISQGKD